MRIWHGLAVLFLMVTPATAQEHNVHQAALYKSLKLAQTGVEVEHFYKVNFPECVLDFPRMAAELEAEGRLAKSSPLTNNVSLATGTFDGFLLLDIQEATENYPQGRYLARLECGSGLGKIYTTQRKGTNSSQPTGNLRFIAD